MASIAPREFTLKSGETALVRGATPKDAASVLEIDRAVVDEGDFTLREPDEVEETVETERKRIREQTEKPGCTFLVAEVEGEVVGFADFENGDKRRTAHSGHLSIFLKKQWREQGVGTALMQALMDWATGSPMIEKVCLAVFSTNTRAMGLYEKMGFKEEGRCPKDMKMPDGSYVDSVLMYRFVK